MEIPQHRLLEKGMEMHRLHRLLRLHPEMVEILLRHLQEMVVMLLRCLLPETVEILLHHLLLEMEMEMVEPQEEQVGKAQNLPVALVEEVETQEEEVGTRQELEEDDDSSRFDHGLDQTTN